MKKTKPNTTPKVSKRVSAQSNSAPDIATALGALAEGLDLDSLPYRVEELADNLNNLNGVLGQIGDGLERVWALSTIAAHGGPADRDLAISHLKKYFEYFDNPEEEKRSRSR